jgi:hypothetical protein
MKGIIFILALSVVTLFATPPCYTSQSLKCSCFPAWAVDTSAKLFNYSVGDTLFCFGRNHDYDGTFRLVLNEIHTSNDTSIYYFRFDSVYYQISDSVFDTMLKTDFPTGTIIQVQVPRRTAIYTTIDTVCAYKIGNLFTFSTLSGDIKLPVILTPEFISNYDNDSLLVVFYGLPQFPIAGLIAKDEYMDGPCRTKNFIQIDTEINGYRSIQFDFVNNIAGYQIQVMYFPVKAKTITESHTTANDACNMIDVNPNPFNSSITIKLKDGFQSPWEISIFSSNGKRVFSKTINKGNQIILNNSDFTNGIYFIKTKTINGRFTKKIIMRK